MNWRITSGPLNRQWRIVDENGNRVCAIADIPGELQREWEITQLIRSAPQLLEALQLYLSVVPICGRGDLDVSQLARAAIAAATGVDLAAETARAATARRNEECQTNNAPPSA